MNIFYYAYGKHKNYSLAEIYQYDLTYSEWVTKYFLEFEIDIDTFYHLPKPTTLQLHSKSLKISNEDIINIILRPDPKASIKKIKNSVNLAENDFTFSH